MPLTGIAGQWLEPAAAATVFAVMFALGLGISIGDFRWIGMRAGLVCKSLFSVLIAVPAIALVVARSLDIPTAAEIGIVLMAISPGAPVALRRSLDAGGHRAFAPALQVLIAFLAVVSIPLSVAILDEVYAGHATVAVHNVARQVLVAQLLPLALGMLTRRVVPDVAARLEPSMARAAAWLLVSLTILVVATTWQAMLGAGVRVAVAVAIITGVALATGHQLGGPEPGTRSAVAISSAARNAGLALLVATQNDASSATIATVLAYLVVSSLPIAAYVRWRRAASRSVAPAR